ncbi:MAG: GNAT family N-acetyltransferase [Methanimicrococcus sp.]|nr:GNAT family N-acetyltransferase [Methanimicrococcus sp.]
MIESVQNKSKKDITIRFAETKDATAIDIVLSTYFLDRDDIPYEQFRVAELNGKIIGCAVFEKLETPAEKGAEAGAEVGAEVGAENEAEAAAEPETFFEIHTIAVMPSYKGKGYGKMLLERLISDIQSLPEAKGIHQIYTRTTAPDFFIHEGFEKADIDKRRRWDECARCNKIEICSRIILVKNI